MSAVPALFAALSMGFSSRSPGRPDQHPASRPRKQHANRIQRMGRNGARTCRGRAAADAAQGRHPRGEPRLRARRTTGSSSTRPSTTSATTSCASRITPSCAAPSRRASGPTASRRPGADPGRRHPAARAGSHPRLGGGARPLRDQRPADRGRPQPVPHLDAGLRRQAAAVEAAPPAARGGAARLPDPAARHRARPAGVPRLRVVGRDRPRAAVRGHARDRRRRVRARRRGDRRRSSREAGDAGRRRARWRSSALHRCPASTPSISGSGRALALGIGGGGDVVGALGAAIHCRALGVPSVVGGVTWERRPIDPQPGPARGWTRSPSRSGACRTAPCSPALTPAPRGAPISRRPAWPGTLERRRSSWRSTVGRPAIADGLAEAAAARRRRTSLLFVDVGGDVLGDGTEPGLASPLCDAVMLAAGALLAAARAPDRRRRLRSVLRRRADARGAARPPGPRRRRRRAARRARNRPGHGGRARRSRGRGPDRGQRPGDPLRTR